MNVSELIDLVAELGFTRSTSTVKERANYARFLNLANLELWQILINSSNFFQTTDVFLDENGVGARPTGYYLKGVFSNTSPLVKCEFANILNIPQYQYNLLNGKLQVNTSGLQVKLDPVDNSSKKYVTLLMIPNCKKLVEKIDDPETEIDTPVFAEPHHLSLVHGALYYLFVSGNGFSDKIKYQLVNWDKALKNFQTFYS